jgi:protein ImuA
MSDSHLSLQRLKRRLESPRPAAGFFALGMARLDERLAGGLARGVLHEVCADKAGDHAAASGFALMLAQRARADRPLLWVREDRAERLHGRLYAPGLVELGIDPDCVVQVIAPDTLAALRAAADALKVQALGAVVIEPHGAAKALDLTASRRLVLAAEKAGATAFVLRDAASGFASAAATRWQVASAPSVPLPGNAPGMASLALTLIRHRGGIVPFDMHVEWDRDQRSFAEPALLRPVLAPAERRSLAA